jgi:cupin superfamily acireductone dioxygenase involved in methionine salvage
VNYSREQSDESHRAQGSHVPHDSLYNLLCPGTQVLREARGYDYEDIISVSPDKLPNYEEKLKCFYEEHIHSDEVKSSVLSTREACMP